MTRTRPGRPATTTSSTRTRPTAARPGRIRPRSRRARTRGSARPLSGRPRARWRRTATCGSRSTTDRSELRVHGLQRRVRGARSRTPRAPHRRSLLPRDDELDAELDRRRQPDRGGLHGRPDALEVDGQNRAHIAWTDTRPLAGTTPEEDVLLRADSSAADRPAASTASAAAAATAASDPASSAAPAAASAAARASRLRAAVPRVVGLRLAKAKTRLRRARCSVRAVRRVRAKAVGKVVAQSPRAGVVRARGFRVRLTVGAVSRADRNHLDQIALGVRIEPVFGRIVRFRERGDQ